MGAHTVMRVAAEYPDLAKAVIMLDPLLGGFGGGRRAPRGSGGNRRQRDEGNERPAVPRTGKRDVQPANQTTPPRISVRMAGSPEALVAQNPRWALLDCQYWALSKKQYHGAYSRETFAVMSGAMRIGESLKKISVPALILKADASPDDRKAHQATASVMQHGKTVHIDNAGHNLHHDQLIQTFEGLSQFMSAITE